MVYRSKLQFPGTILNRKRGRIDLCKQNQQTLKELHQEGCIYVELVPGDPPCEQPIVVKQTPMVKPKPKQVKRVKPKKEPTPKPSDSLSQGEEAPE